MRPFFILIISMLVGSMATAQSDTSNVMIDTVSVQNQEELQGSSLAESDGDSARFATLYVYRPKNFTGSLVGYELKLTNSKYTDFVLGQVKNSSKFEVRLSQEGKTEIWAKTESRNSVFIDVKYGQKYYLKCGITMGLMVGRPDLNLIYPEQGVLDYENVQVKTN